HAILRTSFLWEGLSEPLQAVRRRVGLRWEEEDWRGLSEEAREKKLREFLASDRKRGFNLMQAPPLRLSLVRVGEESYEFVLSNHHLLLDGWCRSLLIKEVYAYYEAECRGERLSLAAARPYRDYIEWLRRQDLGAAEAYWREALKGFLAPTRLLSERRAGEIR